MSTPSPLRDVRPGSFRTALRGFPIIGYVGVFLLGGWVLAAALAPFISPHDPYRVYMPLLAPGERFTDNVFWLGTDTVGRDILSRLLHGASYVLFYSLTATACAYAVGMTMGLVAGYYGGWRDQIISTVANIILSFPVLILYIVIIMTWGGSGLNIVLAVTSASAPGIMRIVRGLTLELRSQEYVDVALMRGESVPFILFVEILPNMTRILIVDACLRVGYSAITIGALGFLGLGLPPPAPDWGSMINASRSVALYAPWGMLFPALAISSLVIGLNFLADALNEASRRR